MFQRGIWSGFIAALLTINVISASAVGQTAHGRQTPITKAQQPRHKESARPSSGQAALKHALAEAFRAARSIKNPADRAEALLDLASAQIRQGTQWQARETLEEALRAAEAIKPDASHVCPHPIVLIAECLAAAGDRAAAHQTFRKAARMIAAKNEGSHSQEWINVVPRELKVESRAVMADTFQRYRQCCERDEIWGRDKLIALSAALNGDVQSAIREITSRQAGDPKFGGSNPVIWNGGVVTPSWTSWRASDAMSAPSASGPC